MHSPLGSNHSGAARRSLLQAWRDSERSCIDLAGQAVRKERCGTAGFGPMLQAIPWPE